jgi:MFS family permease
MFVSPDGGLPFLLTLDTEQENSSQDRFGDLGHSRLGVFLAGQFVSSSVNQWRLTYPRQILDKSVLGYGSIFGLQKDTGLKGNQYSLVGSIAPIAQLAWQPFSSILIVKVPHRILMPVLVLGWGIAQASMAACHSYKGLLVTRFFLGLFEGGCLPLFSIITNQWYRRAEQPIRVAAWYGTNGLATIFAAAVSYGLGHIKSESLHSWQMYVFILFV